MKEFMESLLMVLFGIIAIVLILALFLAIMFVFTAFPILSKIVMLIGLAFLLFIWQVA